MPITKIFQKSDHLSKALSIEPLIVHDTGVYSICSFTDKICVLSDFIRNISADKCFEVWFLPEEVAYIRIKLTFYVILSVALTDEDFLDEYEYNRYDDCRLCSIENKWNKNNWIIFFYAESFYSNSSSILGIIQTVFEGIKNNIKRRTQVSIRAIFK